MVMKYAEITVIINIKEESMYGQITRFFGHEHQVTETDTIIISFSDGTLCDVKKEYVDKNFEMGPRGFQNTYPVHFAPPGKPTFFTNIFIDEDGMKKVKYGNIFKDNLTHIAHKKDTSIYNIIYKTIVGIDALAILKIVSSETSPRYLLAYEEDFFNKDDVIYFVDRAFSGRV